MYSKCRCQTFWKISFRNINLADSTQPSISRSVNLSMGAIRKAAVAPRGKRETTKIPNIYSRNKDENSLLLSDLPSSPSPHGARPFVFHVITFERPVFFLFPKRQTTYIQYVHAALP